MKIATITLHYGFNEGAMLQSWCLAQSLKAHLPSEDSIVHVLDHRYPGKEGMYGKPDTPRKEAMARYLEEELPLSPKQFRSPSHSEAFAYLNDEYDGVVVGSDEVWRLDYHRNWFGFVVRQEGRWTPAFPSLYWPNTRVIIPKASYAAAVDSLKDWSLMPREHRQKMQRYLKQFAWLGVRDEKTAAYLQWLDPELGRRARQTPDPCFSADVLSTVDRDQLHARLEAAGVNFKRRRLGLVLWQSVPAVDEMIQRFRREDYQIIVLNGKHPLADVDLANLDLSPPEWAATFGAFDLCISQRMHGCLFSLLNNTPLIGVDPHRHPLGYPTKMYDLLRQMQLLDYYYCPETMSAGDLELIRQKAVESWSTTLAETMCEHMHERAHEAIRELVDALQKQSLAGQVGDQRKHSLQV